MTYSLDLDFRDNTFAPPLAQIFVKVHTEDEDGLILISPHCLSFVELNHEVDRLIEELEDMRRRAKKKFDAHHRSRGST